MRRSGREAYLRPMDRAAALLLLVLVASVLGVGVVVHRADVRAHEDSRELACLQRAQATATIALLAPEASVDEQGRLDAIATLGQQVDDC
jgi:hypothetical protein